MKFDIDIRKFEELLQIQIERQKVMKELSEVLGYDISFSDEEVKKFAIEEFNKYIEGGISEWMKSLFS